MSVINFNFDQQQGFVTVSCYFSTRLDRNNGSIEVDYAGVFYLKTSRFQTFLLVTSRLRSRVTL